MKNLNQIDLSELVKEQLERSNMIEVSRYNYVKQLSLILQHYRNHLLDMRLIQTLLDVPQSNYTLTEQSLRMYFIQFLEDYVTGSPTAAPTDLKIQCRYCKGVAKLTDSKQIYNGLDHGLLYVCENYNVKCDAYVGVHRGDNLPFGSLANKKTRALRQLAHTKIDVLWRDYGFARVDVYNELAAFLNIRRNDCHIGNFTSHQCEAAIKYTSHIIS